jgi:hypothetical protein
VASNSITIKYSFTSIRLAVGLTTTQEWSVHLFSFHVLHYERNNRNPLSFVNICETKNYVTVVKSIDVQITGTSSEVRKYNLFHVETKI